MTSKYVIAFDSFKGCMSSAEANEALAAGLRCRFPDAEVKTVVASDGGEGWLQAWHAAWGGTLREATVRDPLMRPVKAAYLLKGETAVIEMAQASGLTLLKESERNPLLTTSYGVGELILDAYEQGCRNFVIGLGGSATSDAGVGMLKALEPLFGDNPLISPRFRECRFMACADVDNPLCGPGGAAAVYAPQKGADAAMVALLDDRARRFAEESAAKLHRDFSENPGAGAAGGLGYAFMQYLDAEYLPGAELYLERIGISEIIAGATMIFTGEGSSDRQTLSGKFPVTLLRFARQQHIPITLLSGQIRDIELLRAAGFHRVACINPPEISLEEAMQPQIAKKLLSLQAFSPKL